MIDRDPKIHPPHSEQSVDAEAYWQHLDEFLAYQNTSRLEHAENLVRRWDEAIGAMPLGVFDPEGAEGSRLWDTHILLKEALDHPQAFTPALVEQIFPHWHFQLGETLDAIEHARQYGHNLNVADDETEVAETVRG